MSNFLPESPQPMEGQTTSYVEDIKIAQRRLLDESQPPISRFAPEVLSMIFRFACLPYTHGPAPDSIWLVEKNPAFTLCAVSLHWRRVAITTPQLWKKVVLPPELNVQSLVPLLQVCTERSSVYLLSLYASTVDNSWEGLKAGEVPKSTHFCPPHLPLNDLEHAIFVENASKIRKLTLTVKSSRWPSLISIAFTQLTHLYLHFPRSFVLPAGYTLDFTDLPNLHSFLLKYSRRPDKLLLPWAQIKKLTFKLLPTNFCLETLVQCPNIVKFRFREPCVDQREAPYHISKAITFESLEDFTWTSFPKNNPSLELLDLPSLRRLTWVQHFPKESHRDLVQFLQRFSKSLTDLKILFGNTLEARFRDIFQIQVLRCVYEAAPPLRSLTFSVLSCDDYCFIFESVLNSLCAQEDTSKLPLPGLEALTFELDGPAPFSFELDSARRLLLCDVEFGDKLILKFLEQRWDRLGIPHFSVDLGWRMGWNLEAHSESLRSLVRAGFRLAILEESTPVDWLTGNYSE